MARHRGVADLVDDRVAGRAHEALALATPARLAARGLPTDYGRYKAVNQVPGEYVAVIAPGGSHWLGRSGNVRGGESGLNIIGLDKKC